jgi:hypothetical protein
MTRPPTIVIASLSAIAITGLLVAVAATSGGSGGASAFFLTLPAAAAASLRAWRYSRTALYLCSFGCMVPLMVGVAVTWPDLRQGAPYIVAISALVSGLAGMLAPTARAWYASVSAHRLLDI